MWKILGDFGQPVVNPHLWSDKMEKETEKSAGGVWDGGCESNEITR